MRGGPDHRTNIEPAPGGKEIDSAAAAVAAAASAPPRRGHSSSFSSLPSGSRPSAIELEWRASERLPHPGDAKTWHHPLAAAGRTGSSGGGSRAPNDPDRRCLGVTHPWERPGRRPSSARAAGGATGCVRADHGGSSNSSAPRRLAGESLGSSWGLAATTGCLPSAGLAAGGRHVRPLDGSRGESLQRSLAEAMEVGLSVGAPCKTL